MIVLQALIIFAVITTLYWAAGHHTPTNYAERDENATGSGGLTNTQGDHYGNH